ncbi:MAG: hypothetical protein NT060_04655, partial [Candidatus Omnitrophica bacterium]|nr:hypothetical protein [Candidatus Omnitrophota bacterium]
MRWSGSRLKANYNDKNEFVGIQGMQLATGAQGALRGFGLGNEFGAGNANYFTMDGNDLAYRVGEKGFETLPLATQEWGSESGLNRTDTFDRKDKSGRTITDTASVDAWLTNFYTGKELLLDESSIEGTAKVSTKSDRGLTAQTTGDIFYNDRGGIMVRSSTGDYLDFNNLAQRGDKPTPPTGDSLKTDYFNAVVEVVPGDNALVRVKAEGERNKLELGLNYNDKNEFVGIQGMQLAGMQLAQGAKFEQNGKSYEVMANGQIREIQPQAAQQAEYLAAVRRDPKMQAIASASGQDLSNMTIQEMKVMVDKYYKDLVAKFIDGDARVAIEKERRDQLNQQLGKVVSLEAKGASLESAMQQLGEQIKAQFGEDFYKYIKEQCDQGRQIELVSNQPLSQDSRLTGIYQYIGLSQQVANQRQDLQREEAILDGLQVRLGSDWDRAKAVQVVETALGLKSFAVARGFSELNAFKSDGAIDYERLKAASQMSDNAKRLVNQVVEDWERKLSGGTWSPTAYLANTLLATGLEGAYQNIQAQREGIISTVYNLLNPLNYLYPLSRETILARNIFADYVAERRNAIDKYAQQVTEQNIREGNVLGTAISVPLRLVWTAAKGYTVDWINLVGGVLTDTSGTMGGFVDFGR